MFRSFCFNGRDYMELLGLGVSRVTVGRESLLLFFLLLVITITVVALIIIIISYSGLDSN